MRITLLCLSLMLVAGCEHARSDSEELAPRPIIETTDKTVTIVGPVTAQHPDLVTVAPPEHVTLAFLNSPGGDVEATYELARRFRRVRVRGQICSSACVAMLTSMPHACVEPTVRELDFHSITTVATFSAVPITLSWFDVAKTRAYVETLPEKLQRRLRGLYERNSFITVSLEEFLDYYPDRLCRD